MERLRVQPLGVAGCEIRMVVSHRLGLLVHRAARYGARCADRDLSRGGGAQSPRAAGTHAPGTHAAGTRAMMYRLEPNPQEWIDRSTVINFTFEGKPCRGFGGDTISSALAATLPYLGRSFKYHRPRGILSFANHDSNTLFQVDGVPNVRGDVTPLREGMRVSAINTFGGLAHDKA